MTSSGERVSAMLRTRPYLIAVVKSTISFGHPPLDADRQNVNRLMRVYRRTAKSKTRGQVHVFGQRLFGKLVAGWPKNGPDPDFAVLLMRVYCFAALPGLFDCSAWNFLSQSPICRSSVSCPLARASSIPSLAVRTASSLRCSLANSLARLA